MLLSIDSQTDARSFRGWIALEKDGVIADSPSYSSDFAEHVEIGLRSANNTGVQFTCMMNLID